MKTSNQKGFTLIEIIAVLVILGILAAVAVPKYIDLQDQARNSASYAAVAEGIARVNLTAAKQLLTGLGEIPTAASVISGLDTDAGDFTLAYSATDASTVNITATGNAGTTVANGSATGAAKMPYK